MRLVPYGGGWTDVYADFGNGELYFIISNTTGAEDFSAFMRALYYLSPDSRHYEEDYNLVDYKEGICKYIDGEYVVTKIVDNTDGVDLPLITRLIPWKTHFSWYEEGAASNWVIEREPTEEPGFDVKICIDICESWCIWKRCGYRLSGGGGEAEKTAPLQKRHKMILVFPMDDFQWPNPLLLSGDGLLFDDVKEIIQGICLESRETSEFSIIMDHFHDITADVFGDFDPASP